MKNFAFILLLLLTTLQGCQKENVIPFHEIPITNRTLEELTILGDKLTNPFTVANVRAAYAELYNDNEILNQTHTYARFLPKTEEEVGVLVDNFEVLDDTPLDYEIIHQGDYYHDSGIEEGDFTWLYAVVPSNRSFPQGIEYEVLDDLILIKPMTALYYRMYERTGNGQLLQKGSGGCVPSCLNFPCCFNPNIACGTDPCSIEHEDIDCYPSSPEWPECLIDDGDPPGGGGSSGTNSCGCNNNNNPLKPSGKVSVEDTQFGLQGVKNIWMRTQNDVFGFSWSHTQSDENGCFKFDKAFTAKNIKIKLLYNNERIWMRSWRGERVWNMILPMTSKPIKVNAPFNDFCLEFLNDDMNGVTSSNKEEWVGCTLFNAVEDYHEIMPDFGLTLPDGRLEITITHHGNDASAPMLSEQ